MPQEDRAISDDVLRACIKIEHGSGEGNAERKRIIPLAKVTALVFSYKGIREIDFLVGFDSLTTLKLDNCNLTKIANLAHLTTLVTLDLSFNKIKKIEGLDTLTKLVNLSLYQNKIEVIENLDELLCIESLSLGNNDINNLENVLYLRPFKTLRLLVLSGNPICPDPEYKGYVLAHLTNLLYLDHHLVDVVLQNAALDQYQDELAELKGKDLKQEAALRDKLAKAAEKILFMECNLDLIDSIVEEIMEEDPEYPKLCKVPTLLDPMKEFQDRYVALSQELKTLIVAQHKKKLEEVRLWRVSMKECTERKDVASRELVTAMSKNKKKVILEVQYDAAQGEGKLRGLLEENEVLQLRLMELEFVCFGEVHDLWQEFEEKYQTLVDENKQNFANYFGGLRTAENQCSETIIAQAIGLLEYYSINDMDEVKNEDVRTMLRDKDVIMGAISASHDAHTLKIDSSEDTKMKKEETMWKRIQDDSLKLMIKTNRERIQEIWFVCEKNKAEINHALASLARGDTSHRSRMSH